MGRQTRFTPVHGGLTYPARLTRRDVDRRLCLQLTVFRPFFVAVDLPYSVVRGEVVAIPIVVFNYMDRDVSAEVTLEHSGDLEFAEVSNDVNAPPSPSE